jgi:preprotein translocase subunit SecF
MDATTTSFAMGLVMGLVVGVLGTVMVALKAIRK